jgi:hypothetical protein
MAYGGLVESTTGQQRHIAVLVGEIQAAYVEIHVMLDGVDDDRHLGRRRFGFRCGLYNACQVENY